MAGWQILLSEFDIVYVNQKAVKGSAIADFLASRALEDYEPLSFDFPNEDLMYVTTKEEGSQESHPWKLNFDGASNTIGNGIGAVLVSPNGDYYPFTSKLDFDCTNNIAEYEACIMGIRAAIECEWETRDPKLINYRRLVLELIEKFDDITFCYLLRDENQMADALATLPSMIKVNKKEDMKPIQMNIYEAPAHCCNIEGEEEKDDHPWYQDILRYVRGREYPNQATENDKRTLRRLAFSGGALILTEIDGKSLPNPMNSDSVKRKEGCYILGHQQSALGLLNTYRVQRVLEKFVQRSSYCDI
ncbi:uncharacterized protein LOC128285507 [Gossypium arboreum]|uniref:uncharacterized protein LOC128285507 n=1 Tax=Gossypium arboreum TaxID=29729 RepID=UPI0022F1C671|nr:uncharacterized protein LOC128285507 [Gossypium arboreum]